MAQTTNLLVTYDGPYKVESQVEVEDILSLIHARGSYSAPFTEGVFKLSLEEEPRRVIRRLQFLMSLEPEKFRFTRSWTPVDRWCRSDLEQISDAVSEMGEGIGDEESWKIVLRRDECPGINTGKLIDILSHSVFKPRSSLVYPEKIILVHVAGMETALSLLAPDDMLEVGDIPRVPGEDGVQISLQ